ncbi:hypothetical protein CXG81DRAFT_20122 [Caulochytrium protostelioides]|uniref:Sequence orphan n=1 Tax=Caulochytrium protostelioides TaxID=1555241 RepID=A0A4P9X471_9FUNG|nr:hypothetical protein CXG81DRAFT_20122 [Caulochytrium protostelioides]|eukprot:RKO99853.1 hypothetical protein CXG81DRAFT_20122 [Caulochytrium protostelioides]
MTDPLTRAGRFTTTAGTPQVSDGLGAKAGAARPLAAEPFRFTFVCEPTETLTDETCEYVKAAFQNVGKRIAQALQIYEPIHVQATFRSFCNGQLPCSLSNTLGTAASAAYFSARPSGDTSEDGWAFYPQSLVKQLDTDYALTYNPYDLLASFNADYNFWFSASGLPIQPDQTDFEWLCAHELVHGLGMQSGWSLWSSTYPPSQGFPASGHVLAPVLNVDLPDGADAATPDDTVVTSWQPLNRFDQFLRDAAAAPLSAQAKTIGTFQALNATLREFITQFQQHPAAAAAAEAAYNATTSGTAAVTFQSWKDAQGLPTPRGPNGQAPAMQLTLATSPGEFLPGTSLAHVDYATYANSAEFLMVPSVQNLTGTTFDTYIAKANATSRGALVGPFGPLTLGLLHALGWPTVKEPARGSLTVNPLPGTFGGATNTTASQPAEATTTASPSSSRSAAGSSGPRALLALVLLLPLWQLSSALLLV